MVGLVIVSHSAKLAEGVAEMARGMAGPDVRLAATGGLALPDRPLGTDAELILQAVEQVYSDDGVVVLMDLGSAVLSAEMALEQLAPERRKRVFLSDAPLVEGALAAAVQARLGNSVEQVLAEARAALAPKGVHLGPHLGPGLAPGGLAETTPNAQAELQPGAEHLAPGGAAHSPDEATQSGQRQIVLAVCNRLGLHARPAAQFAQTAGRFAGTKIQVVNLANQRGPANATSTIALAILEIRHGNTIQVTATGPQADAALAALANDNFGDEEQPATATAQPATAPQVAGGRVPPAPQAAADAGDTPFWQGLAASPGIALGPARLLRATVPDVPTHLATDPEAEWQKLVAALDATRKQIEATGQAVARRADAYAAAIFEAHRLFLDDEALLAPARRAIYADKLNAAAAWQRAVDSVAADYRALDDPYLRARAVDVTDVGRQVLVNLLGGERLAPDVGEPGILIAADLAPADTAHLDPQRVLGIAAAYGGPTSHSAILARTFGIPAVLGLGETVLTLAEGTPVLLDGDTGRVWPNPAPALRADYERRAAAARAAEATARGASSGTAITRDGRRVEVFANIGSSADARAAVEAGAEGVGLFRTEFLFLDRRTAPDEDEQFAAYRAAAEALGQRPLTIRTLDVGGDKPLPYVDMGQEANPFLGWRAIRLCLAQPDFFKVQLRAIVRAAAEFPIRVMFPMIAVLSEWRAARALLGEAMSELRQRGLAVPEKIETGIMVEIPAAALRAEPFAAEVDFFSIGTNDLTQYTLAAERGNSRVAGLSDALQPAVLELIRLTVEGAHRHGRWAGVCGELAGDPLAMPVLVGLGVDELSMNGPAIPRAKQIIRGLNYGAERARAPGILELDAAEDVRAALAN